MQNDSGVSKGFSSADVDSRTSLGKGKAKEGLNRVTGVVTYYSPSKGYGFIKIDNSEMEVFVHSSAISGINKSLSVGQRVELSIVGSSQLSESLETEARKEYEREKILNARKSQIVLQISGETKSDYTIHKLTPEYLLEGITPYLIAINGIQKIIDEIQGRTSNEVIITSITQNSPVSVSLDGASEAIQLIKDSVIPWRRKHAEIMAMLAEREKQTEIENKTAEILEKRARAAKDRAETEKLLVEAAKQRQEVEKAKLENEKLRISIHREKIQLALDMLQSISPNIAETDKIAYLIKLLPHLETLITSTIEIHKG